MIRSSGDLDTPHARGHVSFGWCSGKMSQTSKNKSRYEQKKGLAKSRRKRERDAEMEL